MEAYSQSKVDELKAGNLDGYILKRASPSCGMERVKVFGKGGSPTKSGVGVFARNLMERWPTLPVEEEGRLNDPPLEKREAVQLIEDYRLGLLPLVVPITPLRHHVLKHHIEYMMGQLSLEPHPRELMLRNRV